MLRTRAKPGVKKNRPAMVVTLPEAGIKKIHKHTTYFLLSWFSDRFSYFPVTTGGPARGDRIASIHHLAGSRRPHGREKSTTAGNIRYHLTLIRAAGGVCDSQTFEQE